MIKLWTINRVLRWTGFRLFVDVDHGPERRPTLIGLKWVGLPGSKGWRLMLPEGHPRALRVADYLERGDIEERPE